MIKLYKYMPGDRAAAFLERPLLRITNPNGLNDPFEFALTQKIANDIESLLSEKQGRGPGFASYSDHFLSYGIVSLSRTHDNLLMWSHYADEHRGAVLRFDVCESNPYELFGLPFELRNDDLISAGSVEYRKTRPYDEAVTFESMKEIRRHYIFSKSDEWIYEKEFRYVMHYSLADLIRVRHSELELAFRNANLNFDEFLGGGGVVQDHENLWIDIHGSNIKPSLVFQMWIMTKQMQSLFFKIVNLEYLSKMILGCQHAGEIDAAIRSDSSITVRNKFITQDGYQNVVQAVLSDERFELEFENYHGPLRSAFL